MPSPLDLFNVPRKRKDDYFEFIALSGKHEAFDLDKAEPFFSRPDLRRCEILFRIKRDRWVLTYVPFPGDIPPWVDSHTGSDELDLWEKPCPPNRELDRADSARWFQLINERELPEGLDPVAERQEPDRLNEPSRLNHHWRGPNPPTSEGGSLATDARTDESRQIIQSTSAPCAEGVRSSKARLNKKRNGSKADAVVGYLVTFIEHCVEAQKAGLPVPPL